MATTFSIKNNLNQVIQSLVRDGEEFVSKRISPREIFSVAEADISPVMTSQIQNGILTIIEVFDPGEGVPMPNGITDEQKAAVSGANEPSASNPFATMADVSPSFEHASTAVYVDNNRVDVYVQDGTVERPYKTIAAATVAVAAKPETVIVVYPGTYTEDVVLPNSISLVGIGYVRIQGTLTTGTTDNTLRNLGIYGNITINGMSNVDTVFCTGMVTINDDCQSHGFIIRTSGNVALVCNCTAGQTVTFNNCTIKTEGDFNTIQHSGGLLVLNTAELLGNSATNAVVVSTGGTFVTQLGFALNTGGGNAIECNNGASTVPNMIVDTLIQGNIEAGSASMVADAVYGSGVVNGTALLTPVTGSN